MREAKFRAGAQRGTGRSALAQRSAPRARAASGTASPEPSRSNQRSEPPGGNPQSEALRGGPRSEGLRGNSRSEALRRAPRSEPSRGNQRSEPSRRAPRSEASRGNSRVGARSRAPAVAPEPPPEPPRPPPIRLRIVLLLSLLGLGVHSLAPRALANWRLHGAATELANYAVCMVGPPGPRLLREEPLEFWRHVRRRLIGAEASQRPFAACGKTFGAVEQDERRRAAHAARADELAEYARPDGAEAPFTLADLVVTTEALERLLSEAQPFAPDDYDELVRPSSKAVVAPAAVELPVPGRGRGLPADALPLGAAVPIEGGHLLVEGRDVNLRAFRSSDGGSTWQPADATSAVARALGGRCSVASGAPSFRLSVANERWQVETHVEGSLAGSASLASSAATLLDFSCDGEAALVALADERTARVALKLCPAQKPCRPLELPALMAGSLAQGTRLAAARVRGATVLALTRQGIVRVASSRDDGRTWTPWTVAYDREERGALGRVESPPSRLLALEGRVLLYGEASSPGGDYPSLVSDDFGASWRAL